MTNEALAILFDAWLAAREGNAVVVEDANVPLAHDLCERGWLARCCDSEQMAWHWTPQAEVALLSGQLVTNAEDRRN